MGNKKNTSLLLILLLSPFSGSFAASGKTYLFSAPPRGSETKEREVYEPIASYLSQVTGKNIVYKHPDNWLNYQNLMQQGKYDLVFDGPHFIGWRMEKPGHQPLVKLPGSYLLLSWRETIKPLSTSLGDLINKYSIYLVRITNKERAQQMISGILP